MSAKKNDPNQLDWFASIPGRETQETTPESGTAPEEPVAPTPASPTDAGNPLPEPDIEEPVEDETSAEPTPDTSFNPAEWEPPSQEPSPEPLPPAAPSGDRPESGDGDSGEFDPFASDPFFNPSVAEPAATPEELLLDRIVSQPGSTPASSASEAELQAAVAARQQAEAGLESARRELAALQERCALLETERDAARTETDRERQRHAEAEKTARARQSVTPLPPLAASMPSTRRAGGTTAVSRRTLRLAMLGAVVLCVVAYTIGRNHAPAPVMVMETDTAPEGTKDSGALPPSTALPLTEPVVVPAWPALEGGEYRITGGDSTRLVIFQYGVFSRGTTLAPAAERDLARIAAALKPVIASFRIEVEGHTDSSPVRSAHAYSDNQELGMARAAAAADFLTARCGIPADAIATSSAGDSNPPHSGNDPAAQRKNRTVVLKITRR